MRLHALILMLGVLSAGAFADEAEVSADALGAVSRWGFSTGLGYDLTWAREVNPQFGQFKNSPQVFATARFSRYVLLTELRFQPERTTRSGGLSISAATNTFGAWGRYMFGTAPGWQAFASLGGGAHFDRVRTEFKGYFDERAASRRFLGLGAGVSKQFLKYVVSEFETRVTSEEAMRQPGFSLVFRLGVTF